MCMDVNYISFDASKVMCIVVQMFTSIDFQGYTW